MSEWSRGGGRLPHDEAVEREHFEEVADDVRAARRADRVAKSEGRRPWWKFWARRSR